MQNCVPGQRISLKINIFNDEDIVSEAETKTNPAEGRMQVH